jgi:hypothetical protein
MILLISGLKTTDKAAGEVVMSEFPVSILGSVAINVVERYKSQIHLTYAAKA